LVVPVPVTGTRPPQTTICEPVQTARCRERATGAPDAPPLAGVVARVAENSLLLTVDEPAPAVASAFTYGMNDDDAISTVVHLYLFGDDASAVAAREEPAWQAWMRERFPPADAGSTARA